MVPYIQRVWDNLNFNVHFPYLEEHACICQTTQPNFDLGSTARLADTQRGHLMTCWSREEKNKKRAN